MNDHQTNSQRISDAYDCYTKGLNHIAIFGKWRYDLALEEFNRAIELNPSLQEAYFQRAYIKGVVYKRYNEAILDLNKAIELKRDNMQSYVYRGIFYFHSQQYDKAIKDIEKTNALPKNPDNNADDYWMLGESYIGLSEYDKAIDNFNKSIEFDPSLSLPYSGRGCAYLKKGRLELAIADLNKAVELDKDNDEVYYYRADYWIVIGEHTKDLEDLKTAIKLASTEYLKKLAEFKSRNLSG